MPCAGSAGRAHGEKMIDSVLSGSVYSGFFLDSLGFGYPVLALALAVAEPLVCALAVFLFLRRAVIRTRLLTFALNVAVYEALVFLVFSDLQGVLDALGGAGSVKLPDVCGFLCSLCAAVVCLGLSVLMCGNGVMKFRGRLSAFILTAVFAFAEGAAVFGCYEVSLGGYSGYSLSEVFPFLSFLPAPVAESGTDTVAGALFCLYVVCLFLCFLANRNAREIAEGEKKLREEASVRRHGLSEDAAAELCCCASCQLAVELRSDSGAVLCDRKGIVDASHICQDFVYDPLKRRPVRGASPYHMKKDEDEKE